MKYFPPFRFDDRSGVLSRAGEEVPLTRKAADLLTCLASQPGVLVTHQYLTQHIWPSTHVQPENLKALIHELRRALGDSSQTPTFIKSEPGRGYVFVASVTDAMVPLLTEGQIRDRLTGSRAFELSLLDRRLETAARHGEPQLAIVEGEHGLGKTTLCEALVQAAILYPGMRVTYGQGLETDGQVDEYGVLLDAIELLARQHPSVVPDVFARFAPDWLRRLRRAEDRHAADDGAQEPVPGSERMARELAAALDELAADVPLLLILEDLQWADAASLDCLRVISRRHIKSRLCIVLTYCSSSGLPAVQAIERIERDFQGTTRGAMIALRPITEVELLRHLEQRIGNAAEAVHRPIFDAIGGNPSLAVKIVDGLIRLGALQEASSGWRRRSPTDDDLDRMLTGVLGDVLKDQIDRLSAEDRAMLQAGAATGLEFTADHLGASLGVETSRVAGIERRLRIMAARHLLIDVADLAAQRRGGRATWFRFRPELVAQMLSDRPPQVRQFRRLG